MSGVCDDSTGIGRADSSANGSIVVQNWYGAPGELIGGSQRGLVPGLVRFDVRADGSGCDKIWESDALATTATLKLSTATGLLYGGMLDRSVDGVDAYYMGAVDFATGKVSVVLTLDKRLPDTISGLSIASGGRRLIWTQLDQISSDIILMQNFH